MGSRLVDKLADTSNAYSWDEWNSFEENYFRDLGFEGNSLRMLNFQIHPSITGPIMSPNWVHFLPSNTVDRLHSTNDLNTVFPTIVNETYDRVTSEIDLNLNSLNKTLSATARIDAPSDTTAQLKGILCDRLIHQLRGNVNLDKIHSSVEPPEEARMTLTQDSIDVLVTCHSNRNFQNIEIYSIENRSEFFDTAFGYDTYMFEKLRQSSTRPEYTIENVAFEIEGESWYNSEPPQDSIVYRFTDQKGRVEFYEIEEPSVLFAESWGDIETMREMINGCENRHIGSSSGDWYMLSGMCCQPF